MRPKIEWTDVLIKATTFAFFTISANQVLGQEKSITGTVKDLEGRPIASATIKVVGDDQRSISTDNNGHFNLKVPSVARQLSVSYVGSTTQTVDIVAGKPLQIVLQRDDQALDEVVVVGYQTVKRKDLTGSVASVTGKDIAATPVVNIAQAIQGKLPGVNVVSQDGRPNADIAIRVRGGGSISQSNQPLILVDGIIVNSMNDVPSDLVESIDVLKDASSTAIYGARGANGVIIVTTKQAKEGKINLTYNSYAKFNTPAKYLDILNPYEYLNYVWANADANGSAYRTSFEKLYGLGEYEGNNTLGIEAYRDIATTDMQRQVYKSSFSHNHDLTISGGSAKTKVLFAANYMDDQGMKLNSYAKRANLSLKVTQKIFDNLDFNLDTRFSDLSNMGNEGTTNGSGSLLSSAYRFRPISTQDIKGDLAALREGNIEQYGKLSTWDSYSAYNRIKDYEALEHTQNLRGTAALNWRIRKNLSFQSNFNISRPWGQSKIWGGATYNNYLDDATGEKLYAGSAELSKSDGWNLRWTNTLNYDLNIHEQHKLNVMVGQETSNSAGNSVHISANHFPASFTKDNAFAMIDQYDPDHGTSSFSTLVDSPVRIMSYFGRANYNFADRYLFTFTFRADGSSKFAPTQRWGYFPAAALAWRISEESFAKNINWLDDLKLRLSYGEVGNDGISSNLWSQTWSSETDRRLQYVINNQYQKSYDLSSDQMSNRDLKWETTITRNIGLDFSFFNRKLWGTVDLYKNTTKDLLMQTTLPGITGFTSIFQNIGQTSNKGLEISLSGQLLKNADWNITAGANISFNRGNVDALAENITGLYGTSWASTSTYPNSDYILKEGRPVGLVRGLVYDGFYTTSDFEYANGMYTLREGVADVGNFIGVVHGLGSKDRPSGQTAYPGVVKYKDLDNSGYIDDKDLTVIGDMNAKHTGGLNFNASYKGLDLAAFFNWSYGNQVYNTNKLASLYGYKEAGVYENKLAILKNAYSLYEVADGNLNRLQTPEQLDAINRNASLPLAYNENGVTSSLGIEDGSYLRLNTVTLGYTLPKSLLRTKAINRLRIYGSIYNVWTITGYSGLDPEVNANAAANHAIYPTPGLDWGTYPRARSFVLGLNCSF